MKRQKTVYPGVRYRVHPTRKHGVQADRYFSIRYRLDGKAREEGLGWASEGMTASKAFLYLGKLKEAHLTGNGAQTLAEARAAAKEAREAKNKESLTFSHFFNETYFPLAKADKAQSTVIREWLLFAKWVAPVIGDKPLPAISPLDLERLKKVMADAGQSPRSVCYALALARQVINRAKSVGLYEGDNPVSRVRKPSKDNRRMRFLTPVEADRLLGELLASGNLNLHNMCLLALYCGLRAGEIFNLTWADVDFERQTLLIRDTKNKRNRTAYMTGPVKDMLTRRKAADSAGFVFKSRDGGKIDRVSNVFWHTVKKLELNKGVTDPRDKAVFHTLRHTFASWLVQAGVDLYVIKELLGHQTLAMVTRYAHLSQAALKDAVAKLDRPLNEPGEVIDISQVKIN